MSSTVIYLVRHGESEFNRDHIISGQVNPPLTDKGHKQIHKTKQVLDGVKFDVAYSSDLQRAAKTAEIIYGEPIHESRQIKGLRERNFGSIDGKPDHLLDEWHKKRLELTEEEGRRYKHAVGMESDQEVYERYINALEEVAKQHSGQIVLVGAHGTVIRVVLTHLQNLTYEDFPRNSIKNGDYVKLTYDHDGFKVEEIGRIEK